MTFTLDEIYAALACDNMPRKENDHGTQLAIGGTDGSVQDSGPDAENDAIDGEALPRFGVCPGCMSYLPAWSAAGLCRDCM